jgi:hypothetical protein
MGALGSTRMSHSRANRPAPIGMSPGMRSSGTSGELVARRRAVSVPVKRVERVQPAGRLVAFHPPLRLCR